MSTTIKTNFIFIRGIWCTWPSLDASATDATRTTFTNNDFYALPNVNVNPGHSAQLPDELSPLDDNRKITNGQGLFTRPAITQTTPRHWDANARPEWLDDYDFTHAQPRVETEPRRRGCWPKWPRCPRVGPAAAGCDSSPSATTLMRTNVPVFEDDEDEESGLATHPDAIDTTRSRASTAGAVPATADALPPQTTRERFQARRTMTEEARKQGEKRMKAIANTIGCTTRAKIQYWHWLR
ncbi:hypothetical protein NEOLEDRAFT_1238298 [Neolentinus lepideus HHB14362 ss-1]|uniref:Uncharacterized protein n=1 Tax=Neolentinus lepideus HHB14362 ss-1 TaxID=1314782 RepID=A0A165VTT5_9AGAM|nr:hypothetical protein NEOLEDRAFT_1238298 [Neolentinus lepideus HHB14362 ss-1]